MSALSAGGEHFDPSRYSRIAMCEENHFWFRARNDLICSMLQRYAPEFRSFLEIGCGTGFVLKGIRERFPLAQYVGSDFFAEAMPIAAERNPDAKLLRMDARQIPYRDEFDVIGAFDVLEHIKEDECVIENIFRALKPGGLFIATVPQHPWLWSAADEVGYHVRRYARDEMQRKLRSAGFGIVRTTSFVSLLLPLMAASRKKKQSNDEMAEFNIPPWLNAALYSVLSMERLAISAGLSFPVGGSRLVVARRSN